MSDCICGDKEAINKYGFNPECKLHYFYAVTIEDYNKLLAEVERHKQALSVARDDLERMIKTRYVSGQSYESYGRLKGMVKQAIIKLNELLGDAGS